MMFSALPVYFEVSAEHLRLIAQCSCCLIYHQSGFKYLLSISVWLSSLFVIQCVSIWFQVSVKHLSLFAQCTCCLMFPNLIPSVCWVSQTDCWVYLLSNMFSIELQVSAEHLRLISHFTLHHQSVWSVISAKCFRIITQSSCCSMSCWPILRFLLSLCEIVSIWCLVHH